MLKERATYYYMEDGCNCAEAVLLAANDVYGLGLSDETAKVVGGFGGGMGCGNACGALVKDFEAALGSTMCADLRKIHANQTQRCLKTVLAACDVLESHLAEAAKE